MEKLECDNCGVELERYQSQIKDTNFCSRECNHEYQSGEPVWVEHEELENPEWIRERHHERGMTYSEIAEELGCSQSNVHKRAKQHGIEPQRERYPKLADTEWLKELNHEKEMRLGEIANQIGCTRSAVGYALRRNDIDVKTYLPEGEENHFWRSENSYDQYYGPNWQEKRDIIRERDNHECQACGIDESELEIELHVHHIRPKRKFESIEEANREDNLVALCQPCHNKWEGIPLKPHSK